MPYITDLYVQLSEIVQEIDLHKEKLRSGKKELILIEDVIVEHKEKLRNLQEVIRVYENANDFKSLIDENREEEILLFKKHLNKITSKK